jgi:hypothetical protein
MIWTSNFFNPKIRGMATVSIARREPKSYMGSRIPVLAPSWDLIYTWKRDKNWEKYTKEYNSKYLDRIDPQKAGEALEGKVLLCWETDLRFGHCHRELVRAWLIKNGFECEEL